VVTASDTYVADVLIEGSRISTIALELEGEFDEVIDAEDKFVFPGGIDAHTHLDMPFGGTTSSDDFQTGTLAAAHGGTTTIIDFAIQQKGGTLRAALDTWHGKAEGKAAIDYGFHMIATDVPPKVLDEMAVMFARA
jgi:dihydropyrimidinase